MLFSLVSVWEMAFKRGLGKLALKSGIQSFVESLGNLSISLLELRPEHLYKVEKLPLHHRDPFDRLLIGQALSEKMLIIGSDEAFDAYPIKRLW